MIDAEAPGHALDALIQRFGQGDEIGHAREIYGNRTGRVFEDDAELYEARAASFLEWYCLERPLEREGAPPALVAYREARAPELWALWTSYRSLFTITELGDGAVLLHDLLGGAQFSIAERRQLHGVAEGDLVECRLIAWDDKVLFGRTFCYHPAGARSALLSHAHRIRGEGGSRTDVVDFAASLRVRAERYKHVAPLRVYEASTSEFTLK
jgi:hypothetical protein